MTAGPTRWGAAGAASSAALALSGLAIAVDPRGTAAALHLTPGSDRGVAETRAGVGGTFAALGGWALARRRPDAYTAVGVTWLGAAVMRLAALRLDRPKTDTTYWAYLACELGFGLGALAAGARKT